MSQRKLVIYALVLIGLSGALLGLADEMQATDITAIAAVNSAMLEEECGPPTQGYHDCFPGWESNNQFWVEGAECQEIGPEGWWWGPEIFYGPHDSWGDAFDECVEKWCEGDCPSSGGAS